MKNIITFDFNNMMADAVESGLKKEELKEFEERFLLCIKELKPKEERIRGANFPIIKKR